MNVTCFYCNNKEHYKSDCPKRDKNGEEDGDDKKEPSSGPSGAPKKAKKSKGGK